MGVAAVDRGPFHVSFISTFSACEVSYDNVPVPVENVIGEIGGGFKVSFNLPSAQTVIDDRICKAALICALCWTGCHEHPELWEVQYGQLFSWNDKEANR